MKKKKATGVRLETDVIFFLDTLKAKEIYESCSTRSELINAICNSFINSKLPLEDKVKKIRGYIYESRK